MRRGLLFAFFLAAFTSSGVEAQNFNVTVSANYAAHNIQIVSTQAPMDTGWFIQRTGGRTVWSDDAAIGHLTRAGQTNPITAHASVVINTTQAGDGTYTVNIDAGKVHITSWYPYAEQDRSEQCHVYEDGTCRCFGQHWNICGSDAASTTIRAGSMAAALASRFVATAALQAQGVTVTSH